MITTGALFFRSSKIQALLEWLGLVGVLLIEWLLFRRFVLREVVWAYPPNFDQSAYLQQTYELYEQIRAVGLRQALAHQPATPQGAFLQLQAALLFDLVGHASRFLALSLNFVYFALFQIALVASLRWLSRRWSVAFAGLGLLMTAVTPLNAAGGIYDFRMDFIAFCLYGLFLCCVVRSGVFRLTGWSIAAGLAGALLICFRFIAATYVLSLLAIAALMVTASAVRAVGPPRREALRRLRGVLLAAVAMALLTGPLLWGRREAIYRYYVVNHVTGAEKEVRAAEVGATHWIAALTYYPNNVRLFHAGNAFIACSLALLLFGGFVAIRIKRNRRARLLPSRDLLEIPGSADFGKLSRTGASPSHISTAVPTWLSLCFIAASLLVPLAILTADVSKSPVVGGILVSPLLWLVMLAFVGLTQINRHRKFNNPTEVAFCITAALLVALGIILQARWYSHSRWMSEHRRGVDKIAALWELIADKSKARGWNDIWVFNDSASDYLNVENVEVLTYERHGYLLKAGDPFDSILAQPQAKVMEFLRQSQFAMLSHRIYATPAYQYPIESELEQLHPELEAVCRSQMTLIGHYRIFDREIDLYMRR